MAFEHINVKFDGIGSELPAASTGRPPTPDLVDKLKPLRRQPGKFAFLCDPVDGKAEAAGLRADVRGIRANLHEFARATGDLSVVGYELRTRKFAGGTAIVGRFIMPEALKATPKAKAPKATPAPAITEG